MSLFRRDRAGDPGLPWAGQREQARLDDRQNVMDRLTPIRLTPATWGDDLRARGARKMREPSWYVSWALGLGLVGVVACVLGLYWTGAALFLLAAYVLVLLRFPRIPGWTWVVVLAVDVLFVAPFDLIDRPMKPAHHTTHHTTHHATHHAISLLDASRRGGPLGPSGDELGKL